MRTETYNFRDFMKGTHEEPRPTKSFSFLPTPTASMFLNEPCLVLLGIGTIIVGSVLWEKHLVKNGKEYEAEIVSMITGIVLPAGGIIGFAIVLFKAGRLFL
jgi:hypothetical protein